MGKIINRLKIILDYYALSASKFADSIQVQRSSISHLLSGRNKPSLDFVLKIVEHYEEVDLNWLLLGEGTFPSSDNSSSTPTVVEQQDLFSSPIAKETSQKTTTVVDTKNKVEIPITNTPNTKAIEQIIIFYTDGSFKNYA